MDDEDALKLAREALADGDLEPALALAKRELARETDNADAHTVAALALYQLQRPDEALAHFARAIDFGAEDSRRVLAFNRAACLLALERAEEAEQAFLGAADSSEPELGCLARLNAGLIALDLGRLSRAQEQLGWLQSEPSCARLGPLTEELHTGLQQQVERILQAGSEQIAAGRVGPAREAFAQAASLAPATPQVHYRAGVAAFSAGADADALSYFERVRELQPAGATGRLAALYLDTLVGGLRHGGRGLVLWTTAVTGYDSNVLQASSRQNLAYGPPEQSPFIALRLFGTHGHELTPRLFGRATYAVEQLVYTRAAQQQWSSQDHELRWQAEYMLSSEMRLGAGVYGNLGFNGLSPAVGRTGQVAAVVLTAYQPSRKHRVTASLDVGYVAPLADRFEFWSGLSIDGQLSYQLHLSHWSFGVAAYLRSLGLGAQELPIGAMSLAEARRLGCASDLIGTTANCAVLYRVPLAYEAPGGWLWASYALGDFRPLLRAGIEGRLHREPIQRRVESLVTGESETQLLNVQQDLRTTLALGLTWQANEVLSLFGSYTYQLGLSNVDGGTLEYGDEEFQRHAVQLEVTAAF